MPPPTIIFQDNFSGYAIGSYPSAWNQGNSFFNGSVQHDPKGFFNKCFAQFTQSHAYWATFPPSGSTQVSVFFAFDLLGLNPSPLPLFGFENGVGSESLGSIIITGLFIESDLTLSLRAGPTISAPLVDNSRVPVVATGWNFVQINVTFGSATSPLGVVVEVTGEVGLNGTKVLGGSKASNVTLASLADNYNDFNYWVIGCPGLQGGNIGDVYFTEPAEINNTPFTLPNTHGFFSQMGLEPIGYPDTNFARMSQLGIEVSELPLISAAHGTTPAVEFPNARFSQLGIELVTDNVNPNPPLAQGWKVKES